MIEYGKLVKEIRTTKQLTQKDLADLTGVSQGYVYQLETGKVKAPGIEFVAELVLKLNVNPYAFIIPGTTKLFVSDDEMNMTLAKQVNKLEKIVKKLNKDIDSKIK